MPDNTLKNTIVVTGPITYVVRDDDDIINCDTKNGVITLVLANIRDAGLMFSQKSYYVNDIGNNAVNFNIIVQGSGGNLVNGFASASISTNNGSSTIKINGLTDWLMSGNNSSNMSIIIPKTYLKLTKRSNVLVFGDTQTISAYYLPQQSSEFLNHNPKYFLFKQNSRNNSNWVGNAQSGYVKKQRGAGIYHPTNQNGNGQPNSNIYSGSGQIPLDTEFNLIGTQPYDKTIIPINPYQWIRYNDGITGWIEPSLANFGNNVAFYKVQGKKSRSGGPGTRSTLFYFCIGILNPDQNSPFPYIFGELSEPIKLRLSSNFNVVDVCTGVEFSVENSSIKRQN